jgi:hypothetical protein
VSEFSSIKTPFHHAARRRGRWRGALQETGGRMRTDRVREGQIVRLVDGPFTGFCGEVKEVDEKSSIVKVAVQVYGRVTSMDVAPQQIERMAQNSK